MSAANLLPCPAMMSLVGCYTRRTVSNYRLSFQDTEWCRRTGAAIFVIIWGALPSTVTCCFEEKEEGNSDQTARALQSTNLAGIVRNNTSIISGESVGPSWS